MISKRLSSFLTRMASKWLHVLLLKGKSILFSQRSYQPRGADQDLDGARQDESQPGRGWGVHRHGGPGQRRDAQLWRVRDSLHWEDWTLITLTVSPPHMYLPRKMWKRNISFQRPQSRPINYSRQLLNVNVTTSHNDWLSWLFIIALLDVCHIIFNSS